MTIVDCEVIVDEIGRKKFASGKPITIGGRELVGYVRPDGTVFKRWVPAEEAPETQDGLEHHYVEFVEPDAEPPAGSSFHAFES